MNNGLPCSVGTKGAISELLIASHLLSYGWDVYRAVSPSSFGDLFISKRAEKGKGHLVEVRTGSYLLNGKVTFKREAKDTGKLLAVVVYKNGLVDELLFFYGLKEVKIDSL